MGEALAVIRDILLHPSHLISSIVILISQLVGRMNDLIKLIIISIHRGDEGLVLFDGILSLFQ